MYVKGCLTLCPVQSKEAIENSFSVRVLFCEGHSDEEGNGLPLGSGQKQHHQHSTPAQKTTDKGQYYSLGL